MQQAPFLVLQVREQAKCHAEALLAVAELGLCSYLPTTPPRLTEHLDSCLRHGAKKVGSQRETD